MGDRYYPAALYHVESSGEAQNSQRLSGSVLPVEKTELPLEQLDLTNLEETQEIPA